MTSKLTRTLGAAVLVLGFAAAVSIPGVDALAQGTSAQTQKKGDSDKKPAKGCAEFKKDSKEYKDCVKKEAQENKKDKGKDKDKAKDKDKDKSKGQQG